MSSYLNINPLPEKSEVDGKWDGPQGRVLVNLRRSNNARDIRDTLVSLAYVLSDQVPTTTALCIVTRSKLSIKRLLKEIDQFRGVVRQDLASRVHIATMDGDGRLMGSPYDNTPEFLQWLREFVATETATISRVRSNRQSVSSMLAQLWLRREGPQSFKALQYLCGASYPTVSTAVKDLSGSGFIEHQSDRRVGLKYLPHDAWLSMAKAHGENRKVLRFVDPTGQARTPEAMAMRLFKLQEQEIPKTVAVGGVIGAKHYFPDLDISASPRLDVTVYGESTEFVRKIDAALEQTSDPKAKAVLVVHLVRGSARFIEHSSDGTWAPEVECLADLFELGLAREAMEMVSDFSRRKMHEQTRTKP
jgi:hypothetical protein